MAAAKGCSRMLVAAALMCLLVAANPRGAAGLTCGQVASATALCIGYLRGVGPLTPPCCNSVRGLNAMAQSTADRQTACRCLKTLAGRIPGLKPEIYSALPGKCGFSVGFPISLSTDCSKVH